jgi:hypothetical protein
MISKTLRLRKMPPDVPTKKPSATGPRASPQFTIEHEVAQRSNRFEIESFGDNQFGDNAIRDELN